MASMVVIMGVTGAGKSYFINQLAGRTVVEEGASLESCTQKCTLIPTQIGASKVLLIDTPGFDDTQRTDSDILTEIAQVLSAQYQLGVELKGIIYIHRITDNRYNGSAVKTFEIFKKICGDEALNNVLLVTSRWYEVDDRTGSEREESLKLKFWVYMLTKGSNISRYYGDRQSAIGLISQLLCKDGVVLALQKELVDQGKSLNQTAAGAYVSDELEEVKRECEDKLAALERIKDELRKSDRARRQMQADREAEQQHVRQVEWQMHNLQRPVGIEVRQQIEQKKSGFTKVLPFLPLVLNVLGSFVGIPPIFSGLLTSWFGDIGDFDFGSSC